MKIISMEARRVNDHRPAKRSARELHPVFRDVALTTATVVLVSLAGLIAISLIGRFMDAERTKWGKAVRLSAHIDKALSDHLDDQGT